MSLSNVIDADTARPPVVETTARARRSQMRAAVKAAGQAGRPLTLAEKWFEFTRTLGLIRFGIVITCIHILGHVWFGFEGSWLTPFIALGAAYLTEIMGETARAFAENRQPRYVGGFRKLVMFLLPAHIAALAVSMLLYATDQWYLTAFASSLAIASKYFVRLPFRAGDGRRVWRHVFNPSNFGLSVTMLLFASVNVAPGYQFTTNLGHWADFVLPAFVLTLGTIFNGKLTGRLPLVLAWFGFFALQAVVRALWHEGPLHWGLMPFTSFTFLLYSLYMVTEPSTTPTSVRNQIIFGAFAAFCYAVLVELGYVYALFWALLIANGARALVLLVESRHWQPAQPAPPPAQPAPPPAQPAVAPAQ